MKTMAAYYKKTDTGQSNEIRIDQRSLTFVASIIALIGTALSFGVTYGVMRYQIDAKADRTEVRQMVADSMRAIDQRVTRNTYTLTELLRDVGELKAEVLDSKKRTTDIACELVRPRLSYCR